MNISVVIIDGDTVQGYWPDGIYTAPTDAALKYDIEASKAMGFNMLRKHIKVEPDRSVHSVYLVCMLQNCTQDSGLQHAEQAYQGGA